MSLTQSRKKFYVWIISTTLKYLKLAFNYFASYEDEENK